MELFLDCRNGNLTKLKLWDYILHYRIDINAQFAGRENSTIGHDGYTPLMFYVGSLNCEFHIVEFMIEEGADANHQSRYGHTSTHMLAYGESKDKLKLLKLLKKAGADFDLVDSSGIPCAGNYIRSGTTGEQLDYILSNSITSKYILEQRPFPHGRDAFSEVIVQLSLRGEPYISESIEIIKILIKHQFDINKKVSYNKETPLKILNREIEILSNKQGSVYQGDKKMCAYKNIEKLLSSHGAII
jgi:hypothetical protein